MKLYQHGDTSPKNKHSISGHSFNHQTGCMDTIVDGVVVHSEPLMEPKPMPKNLVVGSLTTLNLNYNSGPSKWEHQVGIVYPNKKK